MLSLHSEWQEKSAVYGNTMQKYSAFIILRTRYKLTLKISRKCYVFGCYFLCKVSNFQKVDFFKIPLKNRGYFEGYMSFCVKWWYINYIYLCTFLGFFGYYIANFMYILTKIITNSFLHHWHYLTFIGTMLYIIVHRYI